MSESDKDEIIRLYESGIASDKIRDSFGKATSVTVLNILKERGIEARHWRKFDKIGQKEIIRLYVEEKRPKEEIARIMDTTSLTVHRTLKKYKIELMPRHETTRKYDYDRNFFEKIDTEAKAYFLGLMYANGYNGKKNNIAHINLEEGDANILEKFKKALNSEAPLNFLPKEKLHYQNQLAFNMIGAKICFDLEKQGCMQAKSLIIKFPKEEQVPRYLLWHFIRGMWDGDGHIGWSKEKNGHLIGRASLVGTKSICNGVSKFLEEEINVPASIHQRKINTCDFRINGNDQLLVFLTYLYLNATIYLDRKYEKAKELTNYIKQYNLKINKHSFIENIIGWDKVFSVSTIDENKKIEIGTNSNSKCPSMT